MSLRVSLAWACLSLVSVPVAPAAAQAPRDQQDVHRLHKDAADIAALEDPKRDAYQKPQEVMQALGIRAGEAIADIGAGSGYFTIRLGQTVPVLRGRRYDRPSK